MLVVTGASVLAGWRTRGTAGALIGLLVAGAITGLAVVVYRPFYADYVPLIGGAEGPFIGRFLGWVREPSPLKLWLQVWGGWLFLALSYVAVGSWCAGGAGPAGTARTGGAGWSPCSR